MYNPMATFLFNPEGAVIKNFLSKKAVFSYETLLLFFLIWFIFTIITYGTAIPAGLFLPGILIGCSLGRVLGLFIENYIVQEIHPSTYAIIGAASMLAGYSRLSFSLAVIMLETTENVNLFLPVIFALFVSFAVGGIFNKSMYVGAVSVKNFPFLNERVPMCNELITAEQIMAMPIVTLKHKVSVKIIYNKLSDNKFDGFPIVNDQGQCIGIINRHSLLVLLDHLDKLCSWKNGKYAAIQENTTERSEESNEDLTAELRNRKGNNINDQEDDSEEPASNDNTTIDWSAFNVNFHSSVPNIHQFDKVLKENGSRSIDLRPYMIPRPLTVFENDGIQKCLDVFRLMNLRHLPVICEDDGTIVGMITR